MARELASESARLDRALNQWQAWRTPPPERPTPVLRVPSNSNAVWLVGAGTDWRAVVRLNSARPVPGVDRRVEQRVLSLLAGSPLTPELLWLDPDDDHLVTRHVDSSDPPVDPLPAIPLLVELHAIRVAPQDLPLLDLEPLIEHYLRAIRAHAIAPAVCRAFDRVATRIRALPDAAGAAPCLCHGDPHPGNFLWPRGRRPLLIDWEFARRASPLWDLAVLTETHGVAADKEADARLLAAYDAAGGALGSDAGAQLARLRLRYALLDALWWCVRDIHPHRTGAALMRLQQRLDRG